MKDGPGGATMANFPGDPKIGGAGSADVPGPTWECTGARQ